MFTQEELDEKFKGGEITVRMAGGQIYEGIVSRCLYNKRDNGVVHLSIQVEYMVLYRRGVMRARPDYRAHPLDLEYNVPEELPMGGLAFTCLALRGEIVLLRPKWATRLDHDAIRRLHAAAAAA
jgi:hypothetical protein